MFENIFISYRKLELGIISKLSVQTENIIEEAPFYDEGYISVRIERLKRELNRLTNEIKISMDCDKDSTYTKQKRHDLQNKRESIIFKIVFLASNSFESLDMCTEMLKQYPYDFSECIEALQKYKNGNEDIAFDLLKRYYENKGSVEEHYLINKVFGILLMKRKEYAKAIPFLRYAAELNPEDTESYKYLITAYEKDDLHEEAQVMCELLHLFS